MKFKVLLIIIIIFLISACEQTEVPTDADKEVILVLVDGEPVTLPMLELVMGSRGIATDDHEQMREALDELIRIRVVANAAVETGLADEPEVRAERRLRDMETLYRRYIDRVQRQHPVTDADIEQAYNAQRERAGDTQYRIETITYPAQAEVLRVLARLDDGIDEYPSVREQAQAAGLAVEQPGWIDLSQVPPGFAAVLADSSADEVVAVPLETPQGWRLVRVVDTRELAAPALEEVREGIARTLLQQRRQALIEDLYEQADIQPMLPLDERDD